VVAEEAESGRELWRAKLPSPVTSFRPGLGIVIAFYQNTERWRGFDAATGRLIADGPEADSSPCIGGPGPPGALWRVTPGGFRLEATRSPPVVLAETSGSTLGKCAVNADGTRLAAYLAEEGSMVVWDLITLKPILRKRGPLGFPTFTRHGLAVPAESSTEFLGGPEGDFSIPGGTASDAWFIGEGRFVARATAAHRVDVMNLDEQRLITTLPVVNNANIALADDGSRLLVVDRIRPAALDSWTIPRPAAHQLQTAGPGEGFVAFSGDGSRFASVSNSHDAQSRIDVWTREGTLVRALPAQWLPGTRFYLSADGSRLTVVSTTRRAAVWDVGTSALLLEYECRECYTGVVPSVDGSLVLAVSNGDEVALWDVARRERRWQVRRKDDHLFGIGFSDDGALAAWIDDLSLIIAAAGSGATRAKVPFERYWGSGLAFSHDGKRIAAAGTNGVSVSSVDGSPIWSRAEPVVKPYAAGVLWSLDDSKLILGDDESSIIDSASGELLARLDPEARSPQPHSFASPDLRYVVKRWRTSWSLESLPPPEDGPPSRVLASVLERAGLELRGAELAPADQLRNASASRRP
jgi:WD40 repeat protein